MTRSPRATRDDEHWQRLLDARGRIGREPSFVERCSPLVRIAHPTASPAPWQWDRLISDHAFLYVRSGGGVFIDDGVEHRFGARTVLICRPDVKHGMRVERPLEMRNIHFDLVQRADSATADYLVSEGGMRRKPAGRLPTSPREAGHLASCVPIADHAGYESLFWIIHRLFPIPGVAERLRLKAAMLELLSLVYREAADPGDALSAAQRAAMDAALEFMARHLAEPMSVERIARRSALGVSAFSRLFKRQHGMSPIAYLRRARIERAKSELIDPDQPIKRIAELTGFANVHHFTRVFAQIVGSSPAAWRRREAPPSADKEHPVTDKDAPPRPL